MRTDVSFISSGITLAGHLYVPDHAAGPLPGVVVGHPGSGVKEQAAGLYAGLLAERGFITLSFDAAFQGESGGEPRDLEDPAQRVEDIKAAVTFLTTRPVVAADRIGVLGICASGGYGLAATATDHRIRALGTVSGVDISRQFRHGADGTQDPAVVQGMLDAAAAARGGAGAQTFPLFPATEEAARAGGPHVYEGWEYYRTPRAEQPRSMQRMAWASVDRIVGFDAFSRLDLIGSRPVAMIVGRAAETSWMSIDAFQELAGPKALHWIDGATHVDLYDREKYVGQAVDILAAFFSEMGQRSTA